nr:malonyl CoA-acyl carrier protein transacylase [uncultured bacterium]
MDSPGVAWLFTGQGAQVLGMSRELCGTFPQALRILEQAEEVSGLPLSRLCFQEPEAVLARTEVEQVAVTAITLGCLELLAQAGCAPDRVAGHGVGELAALCAAGVLTVEDTLYLAAHRGRLMHEAARRRPGGMLSVNGLATPVVEELVGSLRGRHRQYVAHYNTRSQTVLSGELGALGVAGSVAFRLGGQAVMLRERGPWHSPLMNEARERFFEAVCRVDFRPPRVPLYLGSTGETEADPDCIAAAVLAQLTQPVRWMQMMAGMAAANTRTFIDVGPGNVLRGTVRHNLERAQACSA